MVNKDLIVTQMQKIVAQDDMVKNLKKKMQKIHEAVDVYDDEGFHHLADF